MLSYKTKEILGNLGKIAEVGGRIVAGGLMLTTIGSIGAGFGATCESAKRAYSIQDLNYDGVPDLVIETENSVAVKLFMVSEKETI